MNSVWIVWTIAIAILLYIVVFYSINIYYPMWRKYKYIIPAIILLFGSFFMSMGVLVLMDLSFIILGSVLLFIGVSGIIIGLMVDFFTKPKVRYR